LGARSAPGRFFLVFSGIAVDIPEEKCDTVNTERDVSFFTSQFGPLFLEGKKSGGGLFFCGRGGFLLRIDRRFRHANMQGIKPAL
jgi:hypothetical protein